MSVGKHTNSVDYDKVKKIRFWRALNQLFSKKQISILNKIIKFEDLSKTERECYSRIIKPRLNAIIDLYDFSLLFRDKI